MKMGGIAWTREEDFLLINCIKQYGEGKWHRVPHLSGLKRRRKSCRLRWLNYLRPNIKRGKFSEDEVDLIFKLHKLLGNRWSLIAGRLPGRTGNDVKNYWNHHLSKKLNTAGENPSAHPVEALAPQVRTTGTSSLQALRNLPAPFSCEGSGQQQKHDDHNDPEVDDEDNPYWFEECNDIYRQLCQEVQFDQDLHAVVENHGSSRDWECNNAF